MKTNQVKRLLLVIALFIGSFSYGFTQNNLFEYLTNPDLTEQQFIYYNDQVYKESTLNHYVVKVGTDLIIDGQNFNLNLPNKTSLIIKRETRKGYASMNIYTGRFLDPAAGESIIMVENKGGVTGIVHSSEGLFNLRPLTGGLHVLIQQGITGNDESDADYNRMVKRGLELQAQQNKTGGGDQVQTVGECRVRVMVCYTDDVAAVEADPVADIVAKMTEANLALENSEVGHQMELAAAYEVAYDETSCTKESAFQRFVLPNDGHIDDIHDVRDDVDADICMLLLDCGDGGLSGPIPADAASAFAVMEWDYNATGGWTFIHELAHLYGCRHEHNKDDNDPEYAHAYLDGTTTWRTLMHTTSDNTADRIGYFSNPDVDEPVSENPTGDEDTEDNARRMDERASATSQFRTTPTNYTVTAQTIDDGDYYDYMALTQISTSGTVQAINGGALVFHSGSNIVLNAGVYIESGSTFDAYIEDCADLLTGGNEDKTTDNNVTNTISDFLDNSFGNLNIYPNPNEGTFNITVNAQQSVSIYIIDMLGKVIYQQEELTGTGVQLSVDISSHPKGVYIVKAIQEDEVIVKRIIHQ